MKNIPFFKYQGAGNDFILIDHRNEKFIPKDKHDLIAQLCDRRFGIGADGLMLLELTDGYDFRMIYYNADGKEGSMCGNGGRCIVAFAQHLGLIEDSCSFIAVDGPHEAKLTRPNYVELKMQEVGQVEQGQNYFLLDTGSPHYIQFVEDIEAVAVLKEGRAIRYNDRFAEKGVNVNFVAPQNQSAIDVATYERGVEDETLACGTGVTAAAIALSIKNGNKGQQSIKVKAKGGDLEVRLEEKEGYFSNIWLCGPAEKVYSGKIQVNL